MNVKYIVSGVFVTALAVVCTSVQSLSAADDWLDGWRVFRMFESNAEGRSAVRATSSWMQWRVSVAASGCVSMRKSRGNA